MVIKKDKINNIAKFYALLQPDYRLLSEGDNIIIVSYRDPYEPKWLRDLCLRKDVERALELSQ